MACERNGLGRIVCVDPIPSEFVQAIAGIELVRRPVQELETGFFADALRDGDMLVIDSTHTVKHDSDCLHLYLRILPAVAAPIAVQVHDVYLPETVSLEQMRDKQVFWGEQYLLYAYMCGNPGTRAVYGSRYHARFNPEMLDRFMCGRYRAGGASFWFEQGVVRN
jgi:hypothetical protein